MIEAEFWDYDSIEEMAAAVAGDIGFIIESAIDARGAALLALPGGNTGPVVQYIGITNREADADDRIVVYVQARLEDIVEGPGGERIMRDGATSAVSDLSEYWPRQAPGALLERLERAWKS